MSKGYIVFSRDFNFKIFQSKLTTSSAGRCFLYRKATESTMLDISREAEAGAPTGTLVLAEMQTSGQARVPTRTWDSTSNGNLYYSLLVRSRNIRELLKLVFVTPVAVSRALEAQGINPRAKWPNDVWIADRKVCGILIRTTSYKGEYASCVGVGINVNSSMRSHPDPTLRSTAVSVADVLQGQPVQREDVLADFCNHFESLIEMDYCRVLELYKGYDLLRGKEITVKPKMLEHPSGYSARAIDFTEDGNLIVERCDDGKRVILSSEEVSIRPGREEDMFDM